MTSPSTRLAFALTLLTATLPALAAELLGIGDPAPKLTQGKYLVGERVTEIAKDKVYVMEFWATWCGPCISSIPHIDGLQKKYADKGLIVIGQNVGETDDSLALVEPLVKRMGAKMSYRVALDDTSHDPDGAMALGWMRAAGRRGLPATFIVQSGKIVWIGDPFTMEKPLEEIFAGNFDMHKAKAAQEAARLVEDEIADAMRAMDYAKIIELIDKQDAPFRATYAGTRMRVLALSDQLDKAAAFADAAIADKETTAYTLVSMATPLIMGPKKDLAAGERLIKAARARDTEDWQPDFLLAKIHAERGQFDKAIAAQKAALAAAPANMQTYLTRGLTEYEMKLSPHPR